EILTPAMNATVIDTTASRKAIDRLGCTATRTDARITGHTTGMNPSLNLRTLSPRSATVAATITGTVKRATSDTCNCTPNRRIQRREPLRRGTTLLMASGAEALGQSTATIAISTSNAMVPQYIGRASRWKIR